MQPGTYYVAKQTERKFGVYFNVIGNSKQHSMHTTKREAIAEARKMNEYARIERQIAAGEITV